MTTRQPFSRCAAGRAPLPFRIMRVLLWPVLLLVACSGAAEFGDAPPLGAAGSPPSVAGSSSGGTGVATGAAGAASVAGAVSTLGGEPSSVGGGGVAGLAGASAGGMPPVPISGAGTGGVTTAGSGGAIAASGAAGMPTTAAGAGGDATAGSGAGGEAPVDCVCAAGPCCDGCHFLSKSHFCGEVVRSLRCTNLGAEGDYWNLFCNGDASECTRWGAHTKYASAPCPDGTSCVGPDGDASCLPH